MTPCRKRLRLLAPGLLPLFALLLPASASAADQEVFREKVEPIVMDYCFDCHGDGMDKGDFSLDDYESLEEHLADRVVWHEIWEKVRTNLMPPAEKKQLEPEEKEEVLAFIEREVFKIDPENPDPGRVTIRRLNREEYRYTVKDIFDVDYAVRDNFPPDDTGYGFDTIGDVLSISPLLMEKYMEAAREIAAEAVPVDGPQIVTWSFGADELKIPGNDKLRVNWIPLDAQRNYVGNRWVSHDGEYEITVEWKMAGSKEATEESGTLRLSYDGEEVVSRQVGWDNAQRIKMTGKARLKRGNDKEFKLSMHPGEAREKDEEQLAVSVQKITMRGPLDGSKKDYPWGFRHIFSEGPPPEDENERDPYREKVLRRLATRIFRRPPDEKMVGRLVALAREVDKQPGKGFEHGIRHAVTAMLASPRFLMRAEIQPDPDDPGQVVDLDEYALASRLSYFLWQSCPDEELLELAGKGELRKNLRTQVDRLLADEKSGRFIRSFVGQWLQAQDVETVHIDARRALGIKDFTEARRKFSSTVRRAMREETVRLFTHVLRENLPATELLTADYAFLNEPLAEFYGIGGVEGNEMRKVDLGDNVKRGGILKQGTFQVVTSNPTRTSPVKRGLFVLENLLAIPPPSAVPDVPPLEDSLKGENKNLTMREALALHAEQKLCASCHARMDPIGFALENYTPAGQWIDDYRGKPIDTAGELMTGEKFANAHELSRVLATERRGDFHRALVEKLLTYALGRGVEIFDAPTVDRLVDRAGKKGGGLRDIVVGIVESVPFQKRRGEGDMFAGRD